MGIVVDCFNPVFEDVKGSDSVSGNDKVVPGETSFRSLTRFSLP